jgi:drug/metabolite transporter (DMT)-like permease
MTTIAWILLAAVLVLDTVSHLLLKSATLKAEGGAQSDFLLALIRQPVFWAAIACFVALLVAWVGFIGHVPLSQGVMAASITIVGVMIGGRLMFGERITAPRALAVCLISTGVLLVGVFAA